MPDQRHLSGHERRLIRVMVQRQKIAALALGSEQRAIEETILSAMLNSAAVGDFADLIAPDTNPAVAGLSPD